MAGNGTPAVGQLPDLGALMGAMMGETADAKQEAAVAAEWRTAMLAHAERQTVAAEATVAALERLEAALAPFAAGGPVGALLRRGRPN